jgi:hypothetical protein
MEKQLIQNHSFLFEIAKLYRKYDLGTKTEFTNAIQKVKKTNQDILDQIWENAILKIKNDDIIKNAKSLSQSEIKICNDEAQKIINSNTNFEKILYAEFDEKELNLTEENRERRIRRIVAEKHSSNLLQKYNETFEGERNKIKSKFRNYIIALNLSVIGVSTTALVPLYQEHFKYNQEVTEWRENGIANSPRVCYTRTGSKYHNCYHYSKRNFETSLFEAVIDRGESPCGTCNPPTREFQEKPKSKYPNPYLITLLPLGLGIFGNRKIIDKREEKLNS